MNVLNRMSVKITNELVKNQIIDESDLEIYSFGIYQGIGFIFNIFTTILIFSFFDMLIQGLIFSIIYFLLRSYAGGFHSESTLACYILSAGLIILSSMIMKTLVLTASLWLLFFILWLFIFTYAPVDTKTKRLDTAEKKVYQVKTRCILIIVISFICIFYICSFREGILALVMSVYLEGIMLVFGEVKNHLSDE